ncbi:MAG: hypothetical protein K2J70_04930 [Muribaculaceae bacterium]|nr:hypothetical protein [Muribaculaceae bacterium]
MKGTDKSREGYDCFRSHVLVSKGDRNQHVNFRIPLENLQLSSAYKPLQAFVTVEGDKEKADRSTKSLGSSHPFEVDFSKTYSYLYASYPVKIPDPEKPTPIVASNSSKSNSKNSSSSSPKVATTKTPALAKTPTEKAVPAKPTATVSKVWIEHNQTINGKKAMKVFCDFKFNGMKGKKGMMCIWIKDKNGNYVNIANDQCAYCVLTPGYDNTRYDAFWKAIYISDINLHPGKQNYTLYVTINDHTGAKCAEGFTTFEGTGASQPSNNRPANNNNGNSNIVKTWRESQFGGFVICTLYQNGNTLRTYYGPCYACHGTNICGNCSGMGICTICQGQGGIITAAYGTYIPCSLCGQTGICTSCKGSRQCICSRYEYPGYTIISSMVITANGQTISSGGVVGSSSRSNSNSAGSGLCPNCHGDRVESFPMYKNDPSGAGTHAVGQIGYTNQSGNKCRYCGDYSWHVHLKCYKCR